MVPLVDAKQSQEVGRDLVRGRACLLLLEQSVQVVSLAQDSALPYVKGLGERLQV